VTFEVSRCTKFQSLSHCGNLQRSPRPPSWCGRSYLPLPKNSTSSLGPSGLGLRPSSLWLTPRPHVMLISAWNHDSATVAARVITVLNTYSYVVNVLPVEWLSVQQTLCRWQFSVGLVVSWDIPAYWRSCHRTHCEWLPPTTHHIMYRQCYLALITAEESTHSVLTSTTPALFHSLTAAYLEIWKGESRGYI